MDLLAQVFQGIQSIEADPQIKDRAVRFLQQWLTEPEFAAYRPQIEWLIQQGAWAGLLDRFYQILPFGTGGRRGAVGIGPNRMNLWTLAPPSRDIASISKSVFLASFLCASWWPTMSGVLKTAVDSTTRPCPIPSCTSHPATWPSTPSASTPPTASTPTSCRRRALVTWPRPSCPLPSVFSRPMAD